MGFSFRLESVLRYRQRIVDQQGHEVALAQAAVAAAKVRLQDLEAEMLRYFETTLSGTSAGLQIPDMVAKAAWLEFLRGKQIELAATLAQAQSELSGALSRLQAAWRDLEVLEQLKIKQKGSWVREQEIRERKDLDEIGQVRADLARRSNLAHSGE